MYSFANARALSIFIMTGADLMSRQPGFVPIPFRIVGKILLAVGVFGSGIALISTIGRWFVFPSIVTLFSIAAIVIGLYLLYVVPRESLD
jgi:hypothetical protein